MGFLKWILGLLLFGLTVELKAAPPVNLTEVGTKDAEELKKIKKVRSLKQSDLTFTEDHNQFNIKIPKDAVRVLFDVKGRSLPGREGRTLFTLLEGDYVKQLKYSKDKLWLMIQTFEKVPRRAWVPLSALKLANDKAAALPPKNQEAGSSSSAN